MPVTLALAQRSGFGVLTEGDDLQEEQRKVLHDAGNADSGRAVHGVVIVALDDCSAGDGLHQLRQLEPAEEQDGEEEGAATTESTRGIQGLAVEETADDERVADDDEELGFPAKSVEVHGQARFTYSVVLSPHVSQNSRSVHAQTWRKKLTV